MGVNRRGLTLSRGDVVLDLFSSEIFSSAGFAGAGLPSSELRWLQGAGDGSIFRGARVNRRELTVPLFIDGSDEGHVREVLADLASLLDPAMGPAVLTMTLSEAGESGEESWTIDVVMGSGGDWSFGETTDSERWLRMDVGLEAGDPFWTRTTPEVVVLDSGDLGSVALSNPGDAPAWATWTIAGPASAITLAIPGASLTYDGALTEGQTLTVDTRAATVKQGTANRYDLLAAAPRFWQVPPGSTTATVTATGATGATEITLTYYPRRRWLW